MEDNLLDEKGTILDRQLPFGPSEARTMSRAVSPANHSSYGLAAACCVRRPDRLGGYRHRGHDDRIVFDRKHCRPRIGWSSR